MPLIDTFKALSDPVRRDILNILKDGTKKSAGDISSRFDLSPATISHHLSILKNADLIRQTKEKNYIYYELNTSVFEEILSYISGFMDKDSNK